MQFDKLNIFDRKIVLTCVALLAGLLAVSSSAAQDGAALFKKNCAVCHEIGEGAKNKIGPHLALVIGRVAGTVPEFRYSKALEKAGASGLVWDDANLDAYIEKPRDFIKGNRMSFRGMADPEDRAALITWLANISNALPTESLSEEESVSTAQASGLTNEILKIAGDAEYGAYLSGDCVTCHQVSGQTDGIPSIVGVPSDYFVRALVEYKTDMRSNEVMKNRVINLSNEEIAALATYFGGLEPQ